MTEAQRPNDEQPQEPVPSDEPETPAAETSISEPAVEQAVPAAEAEAPAAEREQSAAEAEAPAEPAPIAYAAAPAAAAAAHAETERKRRSPAKRTVSRAQRRERSVAKRRRRRTLIAVGGGFIASLLILGIVLPSVVPLASPGQNATPTLVPAAGTQVTVQDAVEVAEGEQHEAYTTTPPTSGAHYAVPAPWGVLLEQQADEAIVRNLQEGAVVVNHNLSDPTQVEMLTDYLTGQAGYPGCLVAQPYDAVADGNIVLTAWGWNQTITGFDVEALDAFIASHRNRGPLFLDNNCGVTPAVAVPTPTPVVPDHTNP